MQKLKTLGLGLLVAFGLTACATQEVYQPVQSGMRVGVASVIGDTLQYRKIAMVAVGNGSDGAMISDWGFDPFVEGEAANRLAQTQSVEPMVFDRSLRAPVEIAYSAALNMPEPLDAYIVIVPVNRSIVKAKEAQSNANAGGMFGLIGSLAASAMVGDSFDYFGLGLYRLPNDGERFVYASADIVLVDGATFQEQRRVPLYATGGIGEKTVIQGAETLADMRKMTDVGRWPDEFAEFTPEQLQAISDTLVVLLQSGLDHSLNKLGMTY